MLLASPRLVLEQHHGFGAVFGAAVDRRIASSGTDYFIVGNDDAPLSNAFVINQADLANRPLRLFGDRERVGAYAGTVFRSPRRLRRHHIAVAPGIAASNGSGR